ncbi:MAG: family 16 glycoside hydrolase [Halioglobus sp.]
MKKLLAIALALPLIFCLLLAILIGVSLQQGVVSRSDLAFLFDLGKRHGFAAVASVISAEVLGVDNSGDSDPGYGRVQIEGRGHAPWVIRGNLDDRPRVIKFALEPELWAAYDTEAMSLYQVWQGDVLFEGAAYNYKHGPQPASTGQWYLRDSDGANWFLVINGEEHPATVRYLGHEYGQQNQTAAMRFALETQSKRVELTETPEIETMSGVQSFTRKFLRVDNDPDIQAGFYAGDGTRYVAEGTLRFALINSTAIAPNVPPSRGRTPDSDELATGSDVIANSDCLSCHGEQHKIAGPAWAQISGKFRGKIQEEVISVLASSVIKGSQGTWGPVPMPPHPELSNEQARAAVAYILSVGEPTEVLNGPKDATGTAYTATWDYDVLERPTALHPSFELENLAPMGFEPKVGGMAFRPDGKLVVSSWDKDGTVFLIEPDAEPDQRVKRIAEGLQEPLGLTMLGDRIFVLQKQELTELIDLNGDDIIDQYRAHSYDWSSNSNFHSFAFGLVHSDDAFQFLLSICVLPGGASCPDQKPTQGKLLSADMQGNVSVIASGFRTPNGIALGADGATYVTDNQGDWLPASKLVRIEQGAFYGSRAVSDENVINLVETPPVVWLPQDEVGNSPTEPLQLREGPYQGQLIHGDVYNGGIKRVFTETVNGQLQGAAFHFSAGFSAPVNRLLYGPDGAIYVGEVGSRPNWGEFGKPWFGLERMRYVSNNAFEMKSVRIQSDGFVIELTKPLAPDFKLSADDLLTKQWFYYPNEQYGGPKYDVTNLSVSDWEVSEDRLQLHAKIQGLQAGHVVYLRLNDRLRSKQGDTLWTAEAWYTLNALPDPLSAQTSSNAAGTPPTPTSNTCDSEWQSLFDGNSLAGWRNYGSSTSAVEKWEVSDGTLALTQSGRFPMWDMIKSALFGGPSGDIIYHKEKFKNFELSLEWKISENGNSGIFYLVADEDEKMPWLTGLEMQVLDNDGHSDGEIVTHRAGDLYDLVSATPETVKPPGQWNEVRIKIKDDHIEHWLNGQRVVSITRGSAQWIKLVANSKYVDMPRFGQANEGYIVLQDHGDPVWYRNIRIRKL